MAELSCGGSCMKYILFLFNIIFFLSGGAILGVGIWALVDDNFSDYIEVVNFDDGNPYFDYAVYTLIAVGSLIFLVGFLGCCGACTESPTLLLFFAILLGVVVIMQVAGGVLAVVFREELGSDLQDEMATQAKREVSTDNNDPLTAAWNAIQVGFDCCGGKGYQDYWDSRFENESSRTTGYQVPLTCCVLTNDDPDNPVPENLDACQADARLSNQTDRYLHTEGCYTEFQQWLEDNALILIGAAFGIAAIEVIGIIFACCVRSQLTRKTY